MQWLPYFDVLNKATIIFCQPCYSSIMSDFLQADISYPPSIVSGFCLAKALQRALLSIPKLMMVCRQYLSMALTANLCSCDSSSIEFFDFALDLLYHAVDRSREKPCAESGKCSRCQRIEQASCQISSWHTETESFLSGMYNFESCNW